MQEKMKAQGKMQIQKQVTIQKQETTWSTMVHQMQIVMLQFRLLYYYIIVLAVVIVPLWNVLQLYIEKLGYPAPWHLHISGGSKMELAIMVIIMAVGSYNILSRNEISMYPGNVISRYGGIVLAFHIMIMISVLASIVGYLVQGILLTAAAHMWDGMILGNAFSLSYLWHGSIRYLGLLLAVYAIGVFGFVLMERFKPIVVYLFIVLLVVSLGIMTKLGYLMRILNILRDFFQGRGYSYATLIAVLFGVWAIMMLLSFCLAGTVRVWKEANKARLGVAVVLGYLLMIGMVWIHFGDGYEYSMDPYIFQQESHQQMETVVDASALEVKDKDLLSSYDMSVKYLENSEKSSTFHSDVFASVSCSASEAKQCGLTFDESKLDQDHIILLLGTRNLTFDGKDLGEDVLRAYQQKTKLVKDPMDEKYQKDNPEEEFDPQYSYQMEISYQPIILLNALYGELGMYMDDTTLNGESGFWGDLQDVTESLLRVVIYPDEWEQDMTQE